eukprot:GHRQ01028852.1.p2 GENE.GHRQ01028852.1~~GHRQ01028852.1.p2  ORF type:complete len:128 (+),score=26.67 GHRQ01028852.1:155-538(+)
MLGVKPRPHHMHIKAAVLAGVSHTRCGRRDAASTDPHTLSDMMSSSWPSKGKDWCQPSCCCTGSAGSISVKADLPDAALVHGAQLSMVVETACADSSVTFCNWQLAPCHRLLCELLLSGLTEADCPA